MLLGVLCEQHHMAWAGNRKAFTREDDRQYIKTQLDKMGFKDVYITEYGDASFTTSNRKVMVYVIHMDEFKWCHNVTSGPPHEHVSVTDQFLDEQGWSLEQIRALDWTLHLQITLGAYWNGESPFQTIEEVIDHLKENSPRLFSTSLTKRAVPL